MTEHRPYLIGFIVGVATSLAGRALDLRRHATHDEFETGSRPGLQRRMGAEGSGGARQLPR